MTKLAGIALYKTLFEVIFIIEVVFIFWVVFFNEVFFIFKFENFGPNGKS